MAKADRLCCWSQFPLGAVVRLKPGVAGAMPAIGVVAEKLDDKIDGFARYGVLVEIPELGRANIVDCCRYEMVRVKKGTGPRKRAQRKRVPAIDAMAARRTIR